MYLVVSKWRAKPGKEDQFKQVRVTMREAMRSQPGVKMIEGFEAGDYSVAVHAYEDKMTYDRIVQDPNGPFSKALAQHGMEDVAEWLGSDKGETID
jgi:hypothetical protein